MTLTKMEKCFKYVIDTIHKYCKQEEPRDKLSKDEFAKLLKEKFPNFFPDLQASRNSEAINALFKEMDQNKDRVVSLGELLTFIANIINSIRTTEAATGGQD